MKGYKTSVLLILMLLGSISVFSQKIQWISIQELEEAQALDERKVLIDVYTDWCGWCKKMDASTFTDPKIVSYLTENYHCVKLDGEDKDVIRFKERDFKFVKSGRRGYNELPHDLLRGRMSYPTLVFLDENLDILQEFRGYRVAKDLLPIVKFFGEDIFKDQDWTEYINAAKGEK